MFDYQAGEKFKLTMIMVGLAGVMAGMFLTMLFMPTPEPDRKHRERPQWASNGDLTGKPHLPPALAAAQAAAGGGYGGGGAAENGAGAGAAHAAGQEAYSAVDSTTALNLVQNWLPLAWDMSAGSAKQSQEKAIAYMTSDCASAYRQNVWTSDIQKQIEASGLQSSFRPTVVKAGNPMHDGSVVIFVEGQQVLTVPGKGDRVRPVKLEYLLKQTPSGIRIAGISESGWGT